MGDQVLLPPGEEVPKALPAWILGVVLVGLLVLGLSTVPAVWHRASLSRDLARLRCENLRQERRLRVLEREVRSAALDSFARERALHALLLPALPTR